MKANVERIIKGNEEVRGTTEYTKYGMETYDISDGRSKKVFVGYSVPKNNICDVRTRKDETWIICGDYEYRVHEELKQYIEFIN